MDQIVRKMKLLDVFDVELASPEVVEIRGWKSRFMKMAIAILIDRKLV
jgi:hypothetical protein